jgi:diguanylate cyclase (GGDEF)-like protein
MRAVQRMRELPPAVAFVVGLGLMAAVALADYVSGDVTLAVFYLLPVAVVTASVGRRAGLVMAGASAVGSLVGDLHLRIHQEAAAPYWNALAVFALFAIVVILLSALADALERAEDLARRDELTGAANGRSFYERAELEIARAARTGEPLTLAYVDVDNFKRINDRHGHAGGDRLLRAVARAMREGCRRTDTVARLGGDEFALLLPDTGPDAAAVVVEKVRTALLVSTRAQGRPATFSIGAITFVEPPAAVEELVSRADELMYAAKRAGKNRALYEVVGARAGRLSPRGRGPGAAVRSG